MIIETRESSKYHRSVLTIVSYFDSQDPMQLARNWLGHVNSFVSISYLTTFYVSCYIYLLFYFKYVHFFHSVDKNVNLPGHSPIYRYEKPIVSSHIDEMKYLDGE